jgi:molybdopterin synthase catalytic subunit
VAATPTEPDPAPVAAGLAPPESGDDWTGLHDGPLPVTEAASWVVQPSCGGVVVFTGTARDHSVGREGVTRLEYEAYEEQVVPRLDEIAAATRDRWPELGRIALLHRIGEVPLTEAAVVVAVSAPHRAEAFEAARFGIDTLKATVPIWKKEDWSEGTSWGREAQHIAEIEQSGRSV